MATLNYSIDNLAPHEVDTIKQMLDILYTQGVLTMKNGSAELAFDDEGLLQEICFKRRRRKRDGEKLQLNPIKFANVTASFNQESEIAYLIIETKWKRRIALQP